MQVTVCSINKTVVAVPFRKRNKDYHGRKCLFNRKRVKTAKKISTFINYLHLSKNDQQKLLFVTITTLQHKSGKSDREIYAKFQRWIKRFEHLYVCTIERQKGTQDLHFHVVIRVPKDFYFDFKREQKRIAGLFSSDSFRIQPHPALFDVSEVKNFATLVGYISKYITKDPKEYCSLFYCRTFSISRNLAKLWKSEADKYVIRFCEGSAAGDRFWEQGIAANLFNRIHYTDFFGIYEYSSEIWNIAKCNYVREMLPDN